MDSTQLFRNKNAVAFEDKDSFSVRRDVYKPKPNHPGIITLDRILTNLEVKEQIISVLSQIYVTSAADGVITNAFQICEHMTYDEDKPEFSLDKPFPWNQSQVLVTCGYGVNEGAVIRILVQDPESCDYKRFASIKYYYDIETVNKIALSLNEAFNNGLYN